MHSFFIYFFEIILVGLLTWIIYKIGYWVIKIYRITKAVKCLPMNPKHWLFGHLHEFQGSGEAGIQYFLNLLDKYPKVCGFFVGIIPKVMVYHPDTVKDVLISSRIKPRDLGIYGYGKDWQGQGLIASSGKEWAKKKKIITPAFHSEVLKKYIQIYKETCDVFLLKLKKQLECGDIIEIFESICVMTMDVILKSALSYESEVQIIGKKRSYVAAVLELTRLWVKRSFRPWEHFDLIYDMTKDSKLFIKQMTVVNNIADAIIKDRKQKIEECNIREDRDFLDMLFAARDENGEGLTNKSIRDETNTFVFAAFDTTACVLSWTLYALAKYPHFQKLCQEEIDRLMDGRNEDSITWNDIHDLNYVTMFLKESMRYFTPVPFIEREADQPLIINDIEFPIGTVVIINLYNLHHNPTIWNEPMKFDPERFLPRNVEKMDHFAYLPFSGGTRNCVGQNFAMNEIKIALLKILKNFEFSLEGCIPPEKEMSLVLKPAHGMHLRVIKRY